MGAESACLLRRLRAFCDAGPERTTCIATSATIVDREDPEAARNFAARFFGVAPGDVATVGEDYEAEVWANRRFLPPTPQDDDLQASSTSACAQSKTKTRQEAGFARPTGPCRAERFRARMTTAMATATAAAGGRRCTRPCRTTKSSTR